MIIAIGSLKTQANIRLLICSSFDEPLEPAACVSLSKINNVKEPGECDFRLAVRLNTMCPADKNFRIRFGRKRNSIISYQRNFVKNFG